MYWGQGQEKLSEYLLFSGQAAGRFRTQGRQRLRGSAVRFVSAIFLSGSQISFQNQAGCHCINRVFPLFPMSVIGRQYIMGRYCGQPLIPEQGFQPALRLKKSRKLPAQSSPGALRTIHISGQSNYHHGNGILPDQICSFLSHFFRMPLMNHPCYAGDAASRV